MSLYLQIAQFYLPYVDINKSVDEEFMEIVNDGIIDAIALYGGKPISRWEDFSRREIEDWISSLVERAYELGKISVIKNLIEQNGGDYKVE